jgi:hypothetical protein
MVNINGIEIHKNREKRVFYCVFDSFERFMAISVLRLIHRKYRQY